MIPFKKQATCKYQSLRILVAKRNYHFIPARTKSDAIWWESTMCIPLKWSLLRWNAIIVCTCLFHIHANMQTISPTRHTSVHSFHTWFVFCSANDKECYLLALLLSQLQWIMRVHENGPYAYLDFQFAKNVQYIHVCIAQSQISKSQWSGFFHCKMISTQFTSSWFEFRVFFVVNFPIYWERLVNFNDLFAEHFFGLLKYFICQFNHWHKMAELTVTVSTHY